ncbi:MAG: hypothetical protein ACK4SO_01900 [Candidatus Kapaibacteriota bacterium]
MNVKQALTILAIVLVSLVSLVVLLFAIYKLAPGIFGIKEKEKTVEEKIEKSEEFKSEPKVVLSKLEYDEWLQKYYNAFTIQKENQFLVNYSRYLKDSLAKLNSKQMELQKELHQAQDSLGRLSLLLNEKDKQISRMLNEISEKNKEILALRNLMEAQQASGKALTDSAKMVVYTTFAKIYENANAQEVAKIIELLDDRDAIAILKVMNKKKAGKVIDMLKPERSAKLLEASFK